MSDASRIRTAIDLGLEGKQVGDLIVPHSRQSSAWGSLMIPIAVIARGRGPTVLVTGGNHGDEYEGQVAVAELIRTLEPGQVSGRVIAIPALNAPAARAGTRLSPIDGGNLNRSFPGRADGSMTSMIAHYIDTTLLPVADVILDLHSGGSSLEFVPSGLAHRLDDPEHQRRTLAALEAFGAPASVIVDEIDPGAGMMDTAAERRGKVFISTELGGGGRLGLEALRVAEEGIRNLLAHAGVIDPALAPDSRDPGPLLTVDDPSCYLAARSAGIYRPLLELGAAVEAGQPVAEIVYVDEPLTPPTVIASARAGMLWCRRAMARIEPGDVLAVVASDARR
jgi:ectoine utilization protein EutE